MADKRGTQELLNQQMWCWGRDARGDDNLLLRAGMRRHRPADGTSSRYSIGLDATGELSLWAFGVAVIDGPFGIFVDRYRRGVRLLPAGWRPDGVRNPADTPSTRRPVTPTESRKATALFVRLLRWMERYERGVVALRGGDYRRRTLAAWERRVVEGPAMADEWRRLAGVYARTAALPFVFPSLTF